MAEEEYIVRSLEPVLLRAAREFPAVVLSGPRQSGKTTLLTRLFANTHEYVSLDLPDVRAAADADPRGFLKRYPPPVIFDELQAAPGLLPYVKEAIDADRRRTGQFLLSGSQNLLLTEQVTESLAGRAAMLRLLPLAWREADGAPQRPLPWETNAPPPASAGPSFVGLWDAFLRGGYPEPSVQRQRDASLWHGSYIQTYLERDVRGIRQVGDLTQFQNLLRVLAARSGQLLNLADVGRDLGVALNTVKAWLSVLEATFQVVVLRPYYANVGKRLVKTPKVYFTDVGTLCYLAGLRDPGHAAAGPLGGAIMETAVLGEVIKTLTHRGAEPRVHFWRTTAGAEVDVVVDVAGRLVPIEVKLSATPHPAMGNPIRLFQKDFRAQAMPGYVVHPGDVRLPLGEGVTALPFTSL